MSPTKKPDRATRLTLLCRGATASNRQARFFSDEPVLRKEIGRAQAIARLLPRFDMVLHAPEASAAETAAVFSSGAVACEALKDVDYGAWSGRAAAEVAAAAPAEFQAWREDPAAAAHGGESFTAASTRAVAWLGALHAAGGHTLAVTHAVVLKLLLAHVLQAPPAAIWRIDVEPLSTLSLTSDGKRWALRGFGPVLPQ